MKPLVIYHKGCLDGRAAAWCFWKKYKDDYEYISGIYQKPPPDVSNNKIFLVDFSYSLDVIKELIDKGNTIVLLDHHKSAINSLHEIDSPFFNMDWCNLNKSGAIIAHDYLFGEQAQKPQVFKFIDDHDRWVHQYPESKAIVKSLYLYIDSFEDFDNAVKNIDCTKHLIQGAPLLIQEETNAKRLISFARLFKIGDRHVPIVNAPHFYSTSVGTVLAEMYDIGGTYYDTDTSRVFSLRSIGDIDVSGIASEFGGGGHKNASGFSVPRSHSLAQM